MITGAPIAADGENYKHFVRTLTKSGDVIQEELSAFECDLIHMALGISGEAGEILDAIKKYTIYRKPLDMENIVEELGDLEFYMEHLRDLIGLDREYILLKNMEKLSVRYANLKFSNEAAQFRADKK